jgi:hypothetical protein
VSLNPALGLLTGSITRTAVNGSAVFDDLAVTIAGVGYTLTATSLDLADTDDSDPFDIAPATADLVAAQTVGTAAGRGSRRGVLLHTLSSNTDITP